MKGKKKKKRKKPGGGEGGKDGRDFSFLYEWMVALQL